MARLIRAECRSTGSLAAYQSGALLKAAAHLSLPYRTAPALALPPLSLSLVRMKTRMSRILPINTKGLGRDGRGTEPMQVQYIASCP